VKGPSAKPMITCVVDNDVQPGSLLRGEHGLAFLVDIDGGRVLFDTGQSGTVLLHNLDLLGIDPATIDALAISHAPYDHTGGLPALLERTRPDLPLYGHPDLFRERFARRRGHLESVGPALTRAKLEARTVLRLSAEPQQLLPGVWTTGEITTRPEPVGGSPYHLVRAEDGWARDSYRDDTALVVEAGPGVILLCGCCHAGLLNTLAHVQRTFERPIIAVAGGTHLASASPDHIRRVGQALLELESLRRVYLNHCSGKAPFDYLLQELGPDVVRSCPAGSRLDL